MKKILITSGGTREYIDGVRVLTNISSGKLGATVADFLVRNKFEVHYVYVKGSNLPKERLEGNWEKFHGGSVPDGYQVLRFPGVGLNIRKKANEHLFLYEVTDVQSVYEIMEKLVPEMDIVIHPMAVSDFGFRPIHTKLKSNDPEAFIESMRERIYQTPKILSHIKEWNPNCFLISFKFEDGLTHEELIKIASESQAKNKSDIVIANDKKEMQEKKSHIAYFIKDGVEICTCNGKDEISEKIFEILNV